MEIPKHKGWHSRGYLPHFDSPEVIQTVTFRLADSLPAEKVGQLAVLLAKQHRLSREERLKVWRQAETYLDAGWGECALKEPAAASIVENALLHFDAQRYHLLAWTIMPNHIHVMLEIRLGYTLADVLHSWKSFTAKQINTVLGCEGRLWQPDYFDRFIRNEAHFNSNLSYIEMNPVKAGLCLSPEDWRFGSARRKQQ